MVEDGLLEVDMAAECDDFEAAEIGSCSQQFHLVLEGVDDRDGTEPGN